MKEEWKKFRPKLKYYLLWIAIFGLSKLLAFALFGFLQIFTLYIYGVICVLLLFVSSNFFHKKFNDSWWWAIVKSIYLSIASDSLSVLTAFPLLV